MPLLTQVDGRDAPITDNLSFHVRSAVITIKLTIAYNHNSNNNNDYILGVGDRSSKHNQNRAMHLSFSTERARIAVFLYGVWYGDYLFNIIVHYLHSTSL